MLISSSILPITELSPTEQANLLFTGPCFDANVYGYIQTEEWQEQA